LVKKSLTKQSVLFEKNHTWGNRRPQSSLISQQKRRGKKVAKKATFQHEVASKSWRRKGGGIFKHLGVVLLYKCLNKRHKERLKESKTACQKGVVGE